MNAHAGFRAATVPVWHGFTHTTVKLTCELLANGVFVANFEAEVVAYEEPGLDSFGIGEMHVIGGEADEQKRWREIRLAVELHRPGFDRTEENLIASAIMREVEKCSDEIEEALMMERVR